MANQIDVRKYRFNITTDIEDFAKLLTAISGRRVPTKKVEGWNQSLERRMTPSDFCSSLIHAKVKNIQPNQEALDWMNEQLKKNIAQRKQADKEVKAGKNRKDPSTHQKPGPKPGKKPSEKYLEAMATLAAERRQMSAEGIAWRKPKNNMTKATSKTKGVKKGSK